MSGRPTRRPLADGRVAAAVSIGCVLAACGGEEPPALIIDDVSYTESELGALTPEQRERLAVLTAFGVLVVRADEDSLIELLSGEERKTRALPLLAAELAIRSAGISDEELRRAYLENPRDELVVRHLVVLAESWRSEAFRQEARQKAERALERVGSGEPFADLAAELSEEPGAAERGGLLRPGREGDWVPEFWRAADRLEEGQVSGVVETQFGFHVLRLEERRPVPFEEVRTEVLLGRAGPAAQRALTRVADSLEAEITVDTAAVEHWRQDDLEEDSVVARWPGGELTGTQLERYTMTLTPDEWARVKAADLNGLVDVTRGVARRERLWSLANELDAVPPSDVLSEIRDEWRQRVQGWAGALGFARGMSPRDVREAGMSALVAERQGAAIARAEVVERAPALRGLIDIERRSPTVTQDP